MRLLLAQSSFRLARSPDGFTRLDEMTGAGFVGCHPYWPGRQKGNWNTGFPIEAGAGSHWEGLGEHQFQLFEQIQTQDSTPTFRHTQILTLQIADPSKISRKWGPRVNGSLQTFHLIKQPTSLTKRFLFISPSGTSMRRGPSVLGIHSGILALRSRSVYWMRMATLCPKTPANA